MTLVLAVALGGALGAPLRYLLDQFVTRRVAGVGSARAFPWGLLTVNTLGSALAGVFLAGTSGDLRILLLVGVCGAFTTFSGFGWETTRLWPDDRPAFWAAVLILPAASVAAFWVAWRITLVLVGSSS
ncbi:MAG TPA: fluoride efflux transporter CrcB [Actinobacteria bacterium]|jgi:CrcB protein|nr:fluoride efflux transporter CrcB [Actinomycetota bacterium]